MWQHLKYFWEWIVFGIYGFEQRIVYASVDLPTYSVFVRFFFFVSSSSPFVVVNFCISLSNPKRKGFHVRKLDFISAPSFMQNISACRTFTVSTYWSAHMEYWFPNIYKWLWAFCYFGQIETKRCYRIEANSKYDDSLWIYLYCICDVPFLPVCVCVCQHIVYQLWFEIGLKRYGYGIQHSTLNGIPVKRVCTSFIYNNINTSECQ